MGREGGIRHSPSSGWKGAQWGYQLRPARPQNPSLPVSTCQGGQRDFKWGFSEAKERRESEKGALKCWFYDSGMPLKRWFVTHRSRGEEGACHTLQGHRGSTRVGQEAGEWEENVGNSLWGVSVGRSR